MTSDRDDARRHLQEVVREALADDRDRERGNEEAETPRDERRDQLDAVVERLRRHDADRD